MEIVSIGTFVRVNPKLAIEPTESRVFIKEDAYEDSNVCTTCEGSGISELACIECNGTGNSIDRFNNERRCTVCNTGVFSKIGKQPCAVCDGTGVLLGKIIDPHRDERSRPSTGTVFAIGAGVKNPKIKPGIKVMYSNYAGITMTVTKKESFRILREEEIVCLIKGIVEVSPAKTPAQQDFEAIGGSKS